MLAAYSAINFGHRHPRLVAAAQRQLERVTLVSRAFEHDQFGPFCAELAELAGMDMVLPMNTGAEAVETAIKTARKWGYEVKGVPDGEAVIIVFDGNFHGRTTTIISFSTDPDARDSYGPYTPGFRIVPYGDLDALRAAMDRTWWPCWSSPSRARRASSCPPPGFLAGVRELCTASSALMIADEIQSGLGRTGTTFACEHDDVRPDMYILGKALGGGIVPVSAVVADSAVLGVFQPGQHGSTFGGNPLACAVAREVIAMLTTGEYQERSAKLGAHMLDRLAALPPTAVREVRGRGLWAGVEFAALSGREACERLAERGVLAKDTHGPRHPAGPAADDQRGRPGLGAGPGRGRRPLTGASPDGRRRPRAGRAPPGPQRGGPGGARLLGAPGCGTGPGGGSAARGRRRSC